MPIVNDISVGQPRRPRAAGVGSVNKTADWRRRAVARVRFRRLLAILVVAGGLMVVAALLYLRSYGPLTATLTFTVVLGVFVSVVLGGGLMATGFYSANSGTDDAVSGATPRSTEPTEQL